MAIIVFSTYQCIGHYLAVHFDVRVGQFKVQETDMACDTVHQNGFLILSFSHSFMAGGDWFSIINMFIDS